ncbi:MAG: hypothetical protein JSS02_03450, partial [Planctomycetes bacterium]|nr:hypothetical protein [Planctomycetota bacterium]
HTNPSQKAAKARALLLAERLVAQHEKTPDAYQVRAYVRAIVGRHASALADIDRARALAGSQNPSGAQTSEPAWLPVIEAFCRFDRRRQEQLAANPDVLPLLRYTQFLMNAFTSSENRRNHAAEALVELRPTCWPALHLLSTCDTLGIRREATAQALTRFPQVLYRQVAKFPGLPEEAAKICAKQSASGAGGAENPVDFVAEMGQRAQLIQALNRAADSAEPSLGYLAALITDTGFQQAKTVLQLEGMLGVSRRESLAALLPLYQDHRFVSYLKYLGAANRQDPNVKESLLSSLEAQAIDLDPTAVMMVVPTQSHARGRAFQLQLRCLSRTDPLYTDLAGARRGAQRSGTEIPNKNQFDLSKVSPNCPQAVAFMVFSGGASSIQQTDAEIEAKYGDEPEVLTAMANRYQNQKGNSADAIHWLKLAAKASGDHRAYSQLATYYHRQGQFAEWRAALDDYLALEPEPGLQRPKTQVEIADYLMRLGEYKAALPYATEAAECYAAWALQCAHRCYDYLGDWARAEAYVRAQVERYDEAFPDWLEWCLWRGRGNVEAARKFAAASAAAVGDNVPDHIVVDLARYYLLIGDAKQALPVVEKVFATRRRHDWEWGLRAAIISDTLEDIAARDKYLSEVAYPPDLRTVANPSHTQLLAQVLSDGFRATDGPQFDLKKIDKILSEIPDNPYAYKTDCQYFGGWFLLKYGPRDKALEYLQQVASSPAATSNRALAAIRLRQEGLEVPPTRVKE